MPKLSNSIDKELKYKARKDLVIECNKMLESTFIEIINENKKI